MLVFSLGASSAAFLTASALVLTSFAILAAEPAPPGTGVRPDLTLVQAQRLAVERSTQISAQDAAIAASRQMAMAAGQLPDPVLRLGIDNLPVDGADQFSIARDFMTMRRIGVMQELTRNDKRRYRSERFEKEAERSIAEKDVAIAAIRRDTALAWLDRYYLEQMRAVVVTQVEESMLEIEAAEGAYRAGRGSQADIFAARASRVALDDRLSELDRRIRSAGTALARWIGMAADGPLAGEPGFRMLELQTQSLEQQLERHPTIAVLKRQVALAEAEVQLARSNQQPDWTVELAYQQRGSSYSNMISIGISVPIQWDRKNRQDRELAARLALAERAKAEQEDTLRAYVAEVRAQLNEWESGQERQARYVRELIPLARERTQAALAAYRGGKGELAAVLAARRNEIDVRVQALQLEMDTARAWAQLNFLNGDGFSNPAPAKISEVSQ